MLQLLERVLPTEWVQGPSYPSINLFEGPVRVLLSETLSEVHKISTILQEFPWKVLSIFLGEEESESIKPHYFKCSLCRNLGRSAEEAMEWMNRLELPEACSWGTKYARMCVLVDAGGGHRRKESWVQNWKAVCNSALHVKGVTGKMSGNHCDTLAETQATPTNAASHVTVTRATSSAQNPLSQQNFLPASRTVEHLHMGAGIPRGSNKANWEFTFHLRMERNDQ